MDLRKLRKFIKENKNLSFSENTTETEREFVIEQKESKYRLKAILTENNRKLKVVLENDKNLVVEEYDTTIENNDDMINKVKDAVALYDMIDDIDEQLDNVDIDNDFRKTLPNSIEDEEDQIDEKVLIDQPQDDQEVELVEKTKREKEGEEDHISDELGIVDESLDTDDFNKKYAIKTNGGYIKLINNNNSYQVVESMESATYSSDKEEMKSQLLKLARLENRPLKAGKIVDLNEIKGEEEDKLLKDKENTMKENGIEVAGVQTAPISSTGNIGESLEIKVEEDKEKSGIEEASKLINDALKIIKDLYEKETDGTIKSILGSIDLNIQIPQGQIDELVNVMK